MKIIMQITDDTIRSNIIDKIEELESDKQISFPSESDRSEFIEECTEEIIGAIENDYYYLDIISQFGYNSVVIDNAESYGYTIDE